MYAVIFRDTHEDIGADTVAITPVKKEIAPAESLWCDGEAWTVMGVYEDQNSAQKRAQSLGVPNKNYRRGFGPTPVRYAGVLLKSWEA